MIFNYLKYISPVWYFNLTPKINHAYFPDEKTLDAAGISIEIDESFESHEAKSRDLAYRAFQLGFIQKDKIKEIPFDYWKPAEMPSVDEYRFLRKNFNPIWVLYVLAMRLQEAFAARLRR